MQNRFNLSNSPLVEMYVGAQFKNDNNLSLATIFNFYNEIKAEFPIIQEHPITPNIIEYTDKPSEAIFLNGFHSRKFFMSQDESKIVQMQINKININWRKIEKNLEYPRFSNVFSEFKALLGTIDRVNKLEIAKNQFEIGYVNHIPLSEFQNNPSLIISTIQQTENLSNIDFKFSIPVRDLGGNATIVVQKGYKNNSEENLILQISLRGYLERKSIDAWFNESHKIILELFKQTVTTKARQQWGEE